MSVRSKTGLLPSIRKNIRIEIQQETTFDVSGIAVPAPYVLRPFAGVYNPFPYGCSILCNHPADYEAKDVVRKAKDTWASEGRALLSSEDMATMKAQHQSQRHEETGGDDVVPEELFRRYTETDSRPITPAPTVASVVTKNSQARRCVTPDPVSSMPTRERTLLVLDLRRSHSQDTLSWQGGPYQTDTCVTGMTSSTTLLQPPPRLSARTPPSAVTNTNANRRVEKKPKPTKRKGTPNSTPTVTPKGEGQDMKDEQDDPSQKLQDQVLTSVKSLKVSDASPEQMGHGDPQGSATEESEVVKRRGKKRRGKKAGRDGAKEGEKEFQGIPDPGETQVSALGNDSRAGSTRPSLTPGAAAGETTDHQTEGCKVGHRQSNVSFLDVDILKQLQRQLDQEVVDAEFDIKRRIALAEALRSRPPTKHVVQGEEMRALNKELQLPVNSPDKWLTIPRVFTRQSARFELPMDSRVLNKMTPLQYAQNYVFASSERLVLYNQVFNLHREELDEDDTTAERVLLGKNVTVGLGEIMGRRLTEKEAQRFQRLMSWRDDMSLDFRTFVGIGAICERLLAPKFCSKVATQEEDPRHEVEQADFESLDRKLLYLNPLPEMVHILENIRDT